MSENKMKQKKSAKKPYLRYLNPRYRRSPRKTNPKYYHERSNSDTSTSTPKSIISEEVDIVTISPTCRNDELADSEQENIDVVPIASTSSNVLQVSMISSSSDDTPDDEGILPTTSGQGQRTEDQITTELLNIHSEFDEKLDVLEQEQLKLQQEQQEILLKQQEIQLKQQKMRSKKKKKLAKLENELNNIRGRK